MRTHYCIYTNSARFNKGRAEERKWGPDRVGCDGGGERRESAENDECPHFSSVDLKNLGGLHALRAIEARVIDHCTDGVGLHLRARISFQYGFERINLLIERV